MNDNNNFPRNSKSNNKLPEGWGNSKNGDTKASPWENKPKTTAWENSPQTSPWGTTNNNSENRPSKSKNINTENVNAAINKFAGMAKRAGEKAVSTVKKTADYAKSDEAAEKMNAVKNKAQALASGAGSKLSDIKNKASDKISERKNIVKSSDENIPAADEYDAEDNYDVSSDETAYQNDDELSNKRGAFQSIGDWAFIGCSSLTSIIIPDGVTNIGEDAFKGCSSLTSITIPGGVTIIGDSTFYGCKSLIEFTVSENNSKFCDMNGVLFSKDKTELIVFPNGRGGDYTIPNSVTSIGYAAFRGCSSLTSITIPNSVTSIGCEAFSGCRSLTSITIPNNVTSIERDTFHECSNLTSITIPNSVTSIEECAFWGCSSLTSITIPNSVTSIEWYAFHECRSLTSITIANSMTSIGDDAFYGCNLTKVKINGNMLKISKKELKNTRESLDNAWNMLLTKDFSMKFSYKVKLKLVLKHFNWFYA